MSTPTKATRSLLLLLTPLQMSLQLLNDHAPLRSMDRRVAVCKLGLTSLHDHSRLPKPPITITLLPTSVALQTSRLCSRQMRRLLRECKVVARCTHLVDMLRRLLITISRLSGTHDTMLLNLVSNAFVTACTQAASRV